MADKHYINVQYKDLKNPGSAKFGYSKRSGRIKQLELSLRRGTGVQPEVHWDVTHAKTDDEIFLKDPIITQHGTNPDKTKLYYHMTLPNVGGVEWTVKCRFGDNPTQHAVANFVTWRRIMLSAQCPTVACARVFESAMSKISKAFAEAYIEVVTNGVQVTGAERPRKQGREGGSDCEMLVTFNLPRWESYNQKFELRVTEAKVEGSTHWRKQDDLLIFDIGEHENYRPQVPDDSNYVKYIEGFKATCEGETLISQPIEYGFFTQQEAANYREICKIRKDGVAVTSAEDVHAATDIVLDLAAPCLSEVKAKLDAGKTVEISALLGLAQFGRSAGAASQNAKAFELTFYPDTDAKKLAGVLTHELAHTMYLVKAIEIDKQGNRIENTAYHTNDYGGQGPHCRHNTKMIATGSTVSGFVLDHDETKGPLCTMHFKLSEHVDDGKFCKNCLAQLRRTALPRQPKDPSVDP